jgi:membrane-associated protease RseP (regulator of RpoE activity)
LNVLLIVLACAHLCSVIHLLGHILLSRPWKLGIETIGFFMGPVVFRRTWKGIRFELKAIPVPGNYVKFAGDELDEYRPPAGFMAIHPLARSLIILGGPLALFCLAALLLGPIRAEASVRHGMVQLLAAAWSHARFDEIYGAFVRFVENSPGWVVLGVVSAKLAAFNLLPIPNFNGGQALVCLLQGRRPNLRLASLLMWIGLLAMLFLYGSYLIALVSWLRKG